MGNQLSCFPWRHAEYPPELWSAYQERKGDREMYSEEKRQKVIRHLENNKKRYDHASKTKLFGLPDEIWKKILSLLSDPKDIWSMWEVHPKFRQLSGESGTNEVLLSQLLSIKRLPHLWKDDRTRCAKLLIFRQVSKRMQISADRLIEKNFMTAFNTLGTASDCVFITLKGMEKLNRLHKAFCEGPIETRAKRVFTRSLCLLFRLENFEEGRLRNFEEFNTKVTSLLETCGEQISYFRFVVQTFRIPSSMGVSENQVYFDLCRWVSLMPNLKRLELNFGGLLPKQEDALPYPLFPRLPQLEKIEIGQFSVESLRKELVLSVIVPNLHIKFLKINGPDQRSEADILFLAEMKALFSMLNLV